MKTLKKLIATTFAVTYCLGAYSQGTVDFDTKAVNARGMYIVTGDATAPRPMTGNNPVSNLPFYAQLYAASGMDAPQSSLQPVGNRLMYRGAGNPISGGAGYLQDLTPVTVTPTGGGPATVQLRAWTGADTYEQAAAFSVLGTPGTGAGGSELINLSVTGNPNGVPPTTQVSLTGLQGYTITVIGIVPEPSTYAMLAIGLFGLGLARSRKQIK